MITHAQRPIDDGEPEMLELSSGPGGLVERLHGQLHEMLLTHVIPLGIPIAERQLAARLGVSRTPLREALRRLEGEGFLQRNSGILEVRRITLEEFLDLLKVRRLLEVEAASAAAGSIALEKLSSLRARVMALLESDKPTNQERVALDLELHRAICASCGNTSMSELIEQLRRKSMLFSTPPAPENFEQGLSEHLDIIDALAEGDAAKARSTMAAHLDNVLTNILSHLLKR
jgi:DNA-binding GntR family transcriptional regulator